MRNIKTTLRYARNSALLFAAASGMTYLTACSETDINPDNGGNNGDDNVLVESIKVTAGTDPSLATTYYNSHQVGTRGIENVPEMKTIPAAPSTLVDMIVPDEAFKTNEWAITISLKAGESAPTVDSMSDLAIHIPAGEYKCLPGSLYLNYSGDGIWKQVSVTEPKYYIDGNVTIGGTGNDDKIEIYILDGGKLTDKSVLQSKTTVYLYGGGDILRASQESEKSIYIGGTLIANGNLSHNDVDIEIPGKVYTTAKLHGKTVTLNGGEVYASCAVTAKDKIYFTGDNSIMKVGYVSAPEIELAGNSPLQIVLRDGGYLNATNTLHLKDIGNVFVLAEDGDEAMVQTVVLDVNNKRLQGTFYNVAVKYSTQIGTGESGADEDGVVLEWNETVKVNGEVELKVETDETGDCAPKWVYSPEEGPDDNNPNKEGDDDPTPGPTPSDEPQLENIGSVAPTGNHTHPISATCVYTKDDKAYLSWHTQGDKFHGCIEYLSVANGEVDLKAWLETSPSNDNYGAIDFNHVIFDEGKIFVAGDHPKKGGILGWIYCNDGEFVTGQADLYMRALYEQKYEKEGQDPKYVNSGSGNCIIRNGNYYQVASIKGFETFNVGDFDSQKYIITDENGQMKFAAPKSVARLGSWTFDPTLSADPTTFDAPRDGSRTGKHIAIDKANSKVAMLTLINRDNTSNTANAAIKVYAANDVNYTTPIASGVIENELLTPVDGKDVIAIEGNNIYVCLGNGGVKLMEISGNRIIEKASFALKNMSKEQLKGWEVSQKEANSYCANGLAVGKDYLYVAHGGAGLVVLDKTTLDFVTRTRYNGGKSANYVQLSGNEEYIYVAYGMSNLQIFGWRKH